MNRTPYREINQLLDLLLSEMKHILTDKLVGLYLFGSLVTGDFDYEISNIDLLVAISSELNEAEFEQLDKMHQDLVKNNREWEDRIEIGYLSLENLRKPIVNCRIALISPGEPFHDGRPSSSAPFCGEKIGGISRWTTMQRCRKRWSLLILLLMR